MITPFASTSSGSISANLFAASLLYARSSQAADSGTLTLSGLDESSATESEAYTLTGKREKIGADQFTKLTAAALTAAQTGDVKIYTAGTAGVGLAYGTAQPTDGDTITFGLTGFTQAYRFKNTTAAAYDVKIGATTEATYGNLKKALNADGVGDGTDYHAGTLANPYVSATVSGAIVTFTDRIPCSRLLGWACAKSGTTISIANPSGGVDGTLLATIGASATAVYNPISLDDETLVLGYLPGLVNWTSDAIPVAGKRFSIHLAASNVTTAMEADYEYSTQATPTVWRPGLSSITDMDNNSQVVTPSEVVEQVRLKINNTNTAAASVNAKLVST